jgi:hypothetical protein
MIQSDIISVITSVDSQRHCGMKFLILIIAALLLAPMLVAAEPVNRPKNDRQALLICKAVLPHNTDRRDDLLVRYQRPNNVPSYSLVSHENAVLEEFVCKQISANDFSIKVGATDINRYIDETKQGEPQLYVEDVAGSHQRTQHKFYF